MKSVMKISIFLLVLTEVAALSAVSKQSLQAGRDPAKKDEPKEQDKPAVVKMEDKIRKHSHRMMTAIEAFRAEVCFQMHEEYGIKFETFTACHKFMTKTCKPGDDQAMDGDDQEVSSGKGFCKSYFPEAKAKAEKQLAAEDAAAASPRPAPGPAPEPAPAPAPAAAKKEKAAPAPAPAAAKKEEGGSAPAPAPVGGPAPAPGPMPVPANHGYYYKDGGKHASRLHMDEGLGLPTQGYWGKLVDHNDMETMTDDWQQEFGPKSNHANVAQICKDHPDSAWCKRRFGHFRSSAKAATALLPLAMALLGVHAF